jgi:hypothetical protein
MDDNQLWAVEEYKAIRAEIILLLERRSTIISYGLAALGFLAGAGATALGFSQFAAAAFVFLTAAAVAALILRIWLGETRRVRRASLYVGKMIEEPIQRKYGHSFPNWEHTIRLLTTNDDRFRIFHSHYIDTVLFFSVVSSVSAAVAAYLSVLSVAGDVGIAGGRTLNSVAALLAVAGFIAAFSVVFPKEYHEAKKLDKEFDTL